MKDKYELEKHPDEEGLQIGKYEMKSDPVPLKANEEPSKEIGR